MDAYAIESSGLAYVTISFQGLLPDEVCGNTDLKQHVGFIISDASKEVKVLIFIRFHNWAEMFVWYAMDWPFLQAETSEERA